MDDYAHISTEEFLARFEQLERCHNSLADWCRHVLKPQELEPALHHLKIIERLEALERGDITRLAIFMPPGHGKSEYASVMFPAWWMARNPKTKTIGVSYGAELAESMSDKIRTVIEENAQTLEFSLQKGSNAKGTWQTTNGCQYRAVGAGGAITGFRAHLIIADDLIKGDRDSSSEISKEDLWKWYGKVLNTRLIKGGRIPAPRGRMLLIMTRWAVDDIAARILEAEGAGWEVLRLPAIADDEDDPLGRALGEPLWPDVFPLEALEGMRLPMSDQDWAGLYQQTPVAAGGNLFKSGNIPAPLLTCDETGNIVRAWDLAATARSGADWSVGTKLLRTPEGRFVVLDVKRFRCEPQELEQRIVETAQEDGYRVRIGLPQDPGAGGKIALSYLVSKLAGYNVESSPESGDKVTRAGPVISQANQGNVQILVGEWNAEWLKEISQFPNGKFDDQVDSLSRAFSMLIKASEAARFVYRRWIR